MSNNKDTLNAANAGEVADKALEKVSGGAAGSVIIPELLKESKKMDDEELAKLANEMLTKANQGPQILTDFQKKSNQIDPQNPGGKIMDLLNGKH